jgi:hypothetical protein
MQVIHKYQIPSGFGTTKVPVPETHTVLDIQLQDSFIVMWCLVDTSTPYYAHVHVSIVPTGREIFEDIGKHVSTWQQDGLVYHAFVQ